MIKRLFHNDLITLYILFLPPPPPQPLDLESPLTLKTPLTSRAPCLSNTKIFTLKKRLGVINQLVQDIIVNLKTEIKSTIQTTLSFCHVLFLNLIAFLLIPNDWSSMTDPLNSYLFLSIAVCLLRLAFGILVVWSHGWEKQNFLQWKKKRKNTRGKFISALDKITCLIKNG